MKLSLVKEFTWIMNMRALQQLIQFILPLKIEPGGFRKYVVLTSHLLANKTEEDPNYPDDLQYEYSNHGYMISDVHRGNFEIEIGYDPDIYSEKDIVHIISKELPDILVMRRGDWPNARRISIKRPLST